ncbi:MAG: hypothetical protein ABI718_16440 [Acidobacteriota bacterium]
MKGLTLGIVLAVAVAAGCGQRSSPAAGAGHEKTYPMTATIISRDPGKNTVNLDNVAVPGEMAAMKMSYELRGENVGSIPADGAVVEVTVHDLNGSYYISDVKKK